jgi:dihydropyrimidinase
MNTGQATLIRNGRVVTATDDCVADILIEGGRIQAIARTLPAGPGMAVHDAAGLLVLPGAVDVHTHLDSATPTASTVDTLPPARVPRPLAARPRWLTIARRLPARG